MRRGLGEVVTHPGEDHVVGRLGMAADTSPCVAGEVAVDALVLQTTVPGAVVDAVGEAEGALDDDAGCARAVCRDARVVGSAAGKAVAGRGRQGLDTAARVDRRDGSVADEPGWSVERAEIDGALCVLGTVVAKDVELRRRVSFNRNQPLIRLDGCECAVGMDGYVRQGGGAVTAYARAAEAVDTYIEILGGGHTDVDEAAAAHLGVVLTTRCGRNHERLVGVVAVAEPAAEDTGFKVPVLRIGGAFDDEIGGDVVGVVGEDVIETAARTGIADEEVGVCAGRGVNVLGLLERQGSGEAVFEG